MHYAMLVPQFCCQFFFQPSLCRCSKRKISLMLLSVRSFARFNKVNETLNRDRERERENEICQKHLRVYLLLLLDQPSSCQNAAALPIKTPANNFDSHLIFIFYSFQCCCFSSLTFCLLKISIHNSNNNRESECRWIGM